MRLSFTKMHGLGNDFVVAQSRGQSPEKLPERSPERPIEQTLPDEQTIRRLADRHTGIGFDQFLWIEPPRSPEATAYYRNFNADGSEAEQCGNGARCIAKLIVGTVVAGDRREIVLEHVNGLSRAIVTAEQVSLELGEPDFSPASLPFITPTEAAPYSATVDGEQVEFDVVSIGNPHAVITVSDIQKAPVESLGPALECNRIFPNRANIGFMQVVDADRIRLRVFERGAGETQACGTGACAAVAIGRKAGLLSEHVVVELPGGQVTVSWDGPGSAIWLTGEAVTVYEGALIV